MQRRFISMAGMFETGTLIYADVCFKGEVCDFVHYGIAICLFYNVVSHLSVDQLRFCGIETTRFPFKKMNSNCFWEFNFIVLKEWTLYRTSVGSRWVDLKLCTPNIGMQCDCFNEKCQTDCFLCMWWPMLIYWYLSPLYNISDLFILRWNE